MYGQHIAPGNICHNKFFISGLELLTIGHFPVASSLFQRDTTCKSIDMKMFLFFYSHTNYSFSQERFCT